MSHGTGEPVLTRILSYQIKALYINLVESIKVAGHLISSVNSTLFSVDKQDSVQIIYI
jgi:hypothetical protein